MRFPQSLTRVYALGFQPVQFQAPSLARALEKGGLAQLVERLLCKQNVIGSNPVTSTTGKSWKAEKLRF